MVIIIGCNSRLFGDVKKLILNLNLVLHSSHNKSTERRFKLSFESVTSTVHTTNQQSTCSQFPTRFSWKLRACACVTFTIGNWNLGPVRFQGAKF